MQVIFEDMMMPLEDIFAAPCAAGLQNMMTAQGSRMSAPMSQPTQEQQQGEALAQNNMPAEPTPAQSNSRMWQNAMTENNMPRQNMMLTRSANTASATQPNRGAAAGRAQVAQQLAQCCFAVHEAVLYLDTHANDPNALEYYRRKQQHLMQAQEIYQKTVGPLRAFDVNIDSGSWKWIETPWPWEIEED